MNNLPHAAPESVGISSLTLLNMMQKLSKLEYLNSIIILRHGCSVMECWMEPYKRETPHQLFSLSKSFTSCAIGLAQSEGRLKITDKLISFFPEYDSCITDCRMRNVTLKDLLTMRSGHLSCATKYMSGQQDFIKAYLSSPLDTEPGTCFAYNSGATYMLSAVIKKVTGENTREYLMPRLFEPLQIVPGIWECCPQGINYGGWGLYLKTEDLAKFSQLLLQHGKWQGKQILPADYLSEAISKQSDTSMNETSDWQQGYGYQFWQSLHGYRGDGASGQFAIILEKEDLCIVTTACLIDMQNVLNIFWETLIPHLQSSPLPESPENYNELQKYISNLKIQPPESVITGKSQNKCFYFQENTAGILKCEVAFEEKSCALTFFTKCKTEQLRAGFGHFEYSTFQLTDRQVHQVAAYAVWKNQNELEIHSFICDGIYRDIWTVNFSDNIEPIKNQAICNCFRPEKPHLLLIGCVIKDD